VTPSQTKPIAEQPKYGGRGRPWHKDFIGYVHSIAEHPSYAGMPDAIDDGRVQWEAPSNRQSGRFKDTHNKRRQWWRSKAKSVGIELDSPNWISRTAKKIHPTMTKPCKICGRVADLRYVYPQERLFGRLRKRLVPADYKFDRLEPVTSLIKRLYADFSNRAIAVLPEVLATGDIRIPVGKLKTIGDWLTWIEQEYIWLEPSILSPGAMSNAPDRFDGFHSDNICCRHTADKGRHRDNLAAYVTDRRVFEYWAAGDWVAADRLIGQVRTVLRYDPCRNEHSGPCDADHIGPISLGFTHRPSFQLLCGTCNSGKNNRMSLSDVVLLRDQEASGEQVISWHSRRLWDLRKSSVIDNETALRLSKLLRDNRHTLMHYLQRLAETGHFAFLTTLLELYWADYDVVFEGVRGEGGIVVFDKQVRTKRITKYAAEQKVRRLRIGFAELFTYFKKESRNAYVVASATSESHIVGTLADLQKANAAVKGLNSNLGDALNSPQSQIESRLLRMLPEIDKLSPKVFERARQQLQAAVDETGEQLSKMWNAERYVRN
jgi:Alw26I/Eco31I/Esp3I family type II restriction endonuclease